MFTIHNETKVEKIYMYDKCKINKQVVSIV